MRSKKGEPRKQRPAPRQARATRGEGVPKTQRSGPESAEDRARPARGKHQGSPRRIDRTRTAREPEGL